ncbi:MAG: carbohydrate ABC transporter permease [Candidatus Gallimonas sp.]
MSKLKKHKKKISPVKICCHAVLIVGGLLMLYPLVFIVMASFFTAEEFNTTVLGFFPVAKDPTLNNLKALFLASADSYTMIYYRNSFLRTIWGTFNSCFTALLAGYVFARLRFKGKNVLFMILLSTQMMPGIVGTMPMYLELVRFPFCGGNSPIYGGTGLYDTWGVYFLLNGGLINIMGMFLVKQAIEGIPDDLVNAAKIDGANTPTIIFRIVFPVIKTIMAYIAITSAIGIWNDWSTPFYYTDSRKLQTIASSLTRLTAFAGQEGTMINYPAILTFSLLLTIPSVIIFAIFQKWIVEGIAVAGIKG